MFTTARRHGIPIPSSSPSSTAKKHQHQQQQSQQDHQQKTEKKSKKDKSKEKDKERAALAQGSAPLSAPPTPSSNAFTRAHAHVHPGTTTTMAAAVAAPIHPRPATSSAATTSSASFSRATGRLLGHAYTTGSALVQEQQQQQQQQQQLHRRPMTASGLPSTATTSSFPAPAAAPSPSASASPSPLSVPLRLTMPRASATSASASVSACATPSPLSSGLPSPTLPPLPSHFSSQPQNGAGSGTGGVGASAGRSPALTHVRSPVINIGSSPLVGAHHLPHPHQHRGHVRKVSLNKDEFDFRSGAGAGAGMGVTRATHMRKFSTSSDVDAGVASEVELKSPTIPLSPGSPRSPGTASDTESGCASSSMHEDVLLPGDRVGPGLMLQGEVLQRVFDDNDRENACGERGAGEEPATELEVVRRLGAGSYAIVYLVREVLRRPPPGVDDGKSKSGSKTNGNGIDVGIDELDLWESTTSGVDLELDMDLDLDLDLERDPLELDGMRRSKSKDRRDAAPTPKVYYGKEYAVKVLSKAGMDDDALDAQLTEASIHQSLPIHPNIVTLHRALETPSFLLLVLEFVPGEDLYYFLEQARDHHEPEHRLSSASASPSSDSEGDEHERGHKANTSVLSVNSINTVATSTTMNTTRTPPTPSLLSTLNEKQLLGRRRLRLIASMFAQMCEAVAVCHDVGVYHRDIKPENFIVTDGWEQDERASDGEERRVVVVKLTDFGLSTREAASSDMDCGSAPYMSYECRNNCAPTYAPRAADVWSLGIVLINMLYHVNPWTDTTQGVCPSFSAFLAGPEHFFLQRFAGMTPAVASFLAQRVFCVLPSDDPADTVGRRVSAREFGKWARELPRLLAREEPVGVPPALVTTTKEGAPPVSVSALVFPPLRTTSPAPLRDSKEDQSSKAQQDKDTSMPTSPLTLSPTSPPSSTLLAQSLAAVLAQQEAAAAVGGGLDSSSPAWRHRRGLSNASVGYALSSVPQSRRPASRQQSFSTATAPSAGAPPSASSNTHAHSMMIPGSAAGSRAATPLLRGRALGFGSGFGSGTGTGTGAGTGTRSRVPSNNCETPSGMGLALGELPTVFDEGEGEVSMSVSGSSGGLELELGRREEIRDDVSAKEQERDRGQVEESRREEFARDGEVHNGEEHEQEPEQEHDQDGEEDPLSSMSRSTSMVRRRKRGTRRGKGQIIQQQQMEIARLQQQQEELARKVQMMQEQLQKTQMQQQQVQMENGALQQQEEVQQQQQLGQRQMPAGAAQVQVQVLSSLNPTLPSANASVPSTGSSSVPQSPTTGDALDSLASASEALARELSRTRNACGGAPTSPLVHAHSYSHLHQIHGSNLALGNGSVGNVGNGVPSLSVSASPPAVPMRAISSTSLGTRTRGVSVSPSPSRSVSQTRSQSTRATQQASPAAALALASAGGPTPGAMFPYSFASSASSTSARKRSQKQQNSSSSSASASVKEAPHATLSSFGSAPTSVSSTGPASTSTPAAAPPTPAPAPAIAKKTSKWKLSFGKGSSNSNSSNSSAHSRTPLPQVLRPQSDIVVDISAGRNEAHQSEEQNDNAENDGEGGTARQSVTSEASAQHGASTPIASRVKSVLTSLDPDVSTGTNDAPGRLSYSSSTAANASGNANNEPWSRGRRPAASGNAAAHPWNANAPALSTERWPNNERNVSPNSTRTGRSGTGNLSTLSSSSSFISQHSSASRDNNNNWRHSTLTTSSATSGWTRYSNSNASMRSVSTVATSVSGASGTGSWRSGTSNANVPSGERKPGVYHPTTPSIAASSRKSDKSSLSGGMPPPNVKIMTGVPWALDELPRQLHPNPSGDIFGVPPAARKQRVRKPKDLPTISERPYQHHSSPYGHGGNGKAPAGKSPLSQRADAGRSSTSLPRNSNEDNGTGSAHNEDRLAENEGDQQRHADGTPRKVQKGQINALAKMLSALRRSNP